ncbi:MAG: hypothetical protein ACKV2T_36910 [Kofleriaceae bacterium]
MSNVLVNFRLNPDRPLRLKWLATDGVPGDGYKAQIIAVKVKQKTIEMDKTAILEQSAADPTGGVGAYMVTFNGMVGFGEDHPHRKFVESLEDVEIDYELTFVHEESERVAVEDEDYKIIERPAGMAHRISGRAKTSPVV